MREDVISSGFAPAEGAERNRAGSRRWGRPPQASPASSSTIVGTKPASSSGTFLVHRSGGSLTCESAEMYLLSTARPSPVIGMRIMLNLSPVAGQGKATATC